MISFKKYIILVDLCEFIRSTFPEVDPDPKHCKLTELRGMGVETPNEIQKGRSHQIETFTIYNLKKSKQEKG